MRLHSIGTLVAGVALVVLGAAAGSGAQDGSPMRFNSGQNIVPVYDGWERNADGSFNMVFGYFNRNYVDELVIPIGDANNFASGNPDRGQPTYFYPRLNRYVFRVSVPKDWATKELVWTLTANGRTERAYGSLLPIWEIDNRPELGGGASAQNQAPSLVIEETYAAKLPDPLTLHSTVSDDGRPPPRPPQKPPAQVTQGNPSAGAVAAPVNVPFFQPARPPQGLSVGWIAYRGVGKVRIEPAGYQRVQNGRAVTTVTFDEPGTYVLRATASDGQLRTLRHATVTVGTR
jgi:hypothetical protein